MPQFHRVEENGYCRKHDFRSRSSEKITVLFGVSAVYSIDRWYLESGGRGGMLLFWLAGKSSHMIDYASALHFFFVATT